MIGMKRLPKKLRYEILPEDIECATACTTNCPHARAIKRVTQSVRVRVYGGRVSIQWGGRRYYYSAPTYTQKFEGAFDTTGLVSPGIAIIRYIEDRAIEPVRTERKEQINVARRLRRAAVLARGESPQSYNGRVFVAA
jgi:hypothetical protein